jgi:hypothetical protein
MQQTLMQAMHRNVVLQECEIALHAALHALLSTQVRKRAERENYIH